MLTGFDLPVSAVFTADIVLSGALNSICLTQQDQRVARATTLLRERPLDESRVIGRVPRDSSVDVNMCAKRWCHVAYDTIQGFAPESLFIRLGRFPARGRCATRPAPTAGSSASAATDAQLLPRLHEREGLWQQLHRTQPKLPAAGGWRIHRAVPGRTHA